MGRKNEWLKKAAEQGNVRAQSTLGTMYSLGVGVSKNDKISMQWHKMAADQGDSKSLLMLGFMYSGGKGTQPNLATAKQYFRLACNNGEKEGCEWYKKINELDIK